MNKFLTSLIAASLAALFLALGCGAWLFWQSWEEGKKLERENRELQASLEASRIRLDNFCEYPVEALCNLPTETGSVSSVMSGMQPPLPEPPAAQKTAPAPLEETPAPQPAAPSEEKTADAPLPEPADMTPHAHAPSMPVPAEKEDSPADSVPQAEKTAAPAASDVARPASEPSQEMQQPSEPQKPAEVQDAQPKKTWTTLEQSEEHLKFRIAGAGPSLTAEGKLLSEPLRYEATLHGLWKIAPKRLTTTLVTDIRREFRNGDTVLTFVLSRQPVRCALEQEDARTIAVIIE